MKKMGYVKVRKTEPIKDKCGFYLYVYENEIKYNI